MRKFAFLLFFIVVTTLTLVSLYYWDVKTTGEDFNTETPLVTGNTSPSKPICNFYDQVEYYYYTGNDPLWLPNNKYGMYVYAENKSFFELAQNLVNSAGGEWGYVLIPYNVKDYDYGKWANVFSMLGKKQLIPIIQLHDIDTDNYERQTTKAAKFLNSFLWPIRFRYISVYNEPNDSKFWYGRVDPEEYARILNFTIDSFKRENPNFFIMNGGLNTTAPTNAEHLDALEYIKAMDKEIPGIFNKLDGWASHSYPQPNFAGSVATRGRWGIQAYDSELAFLENVIGVEKDLPVFITETGWAHAEGESYNSSFLTAEQVAGNFKQAYLEYWLPDPRVRAVIPFTIRYDPPFDHFSWVNRDNVPYKQYDMVKGMPKTKGNPPVLKLDQTKVQECTL